MLYGIVISIYLFTLIGIGLYKSRTIKTQADFSVAGRSLTPWVLVGTMLATWIGTGSILGNAGEAFSSGIAALILPLGGVAGILILTKIAGKARNIEKFTVPEIIGDRFGETSRILSVVALMLAYLVIVSYQYNAGGAVIFTIFNDSQGEPVFSLGTATLIAAVFIISYTMLAGLVSVAYTDVGNGIIMVVSLVIALPVLWVKAGGWSGMEASFEKLNMEDHMQFLGTYSFINVINFTLPPFLLVLGDANMYQRFFASKSADGARKATWILVIAVLLIELLVIIIAWIASSMITDVENGRHVLIYAAHRILPPFLGAIMLTTIIGIIISTADSYLLVPSTTLVRDIYLKYVNKNADERIIVIVSRLVVLILGIISYFVSLGFARSTGFFEKALYAYTIYGAAITPTLIAALFWKRATKYGAIVSILSGILVTLFWKESDIFKLVVPDFLYHNVNEVIPAILISISALVIISLVTRQDESN